MRILPHDSDGACSNGWRLRAMSELWANGHFSHASTCRSPGAAVVTTTSCSSCPDTSASMATCTAIPRDWRNAASSHAVATAWHWIATETRPRPAPPHRVSQCPCQPDAVVFRPALPRCRFDGWSGWIFGGWTAQSVTPHSRLPCFAKHDVSRQCWRWHAQHPVRIIAPRQRDVTFTCLSTFATAPARCLPSTQPGHRFRARPLRCSTRATDSIRAEHSQPAGTTRDQFHQTCIRSHLPARVSWPRRLSLERLPAWPVPRSCGA